MPSDAEVTISLDGRPLRVRVGTSVAAALMNHGVLCFRKSAAGEARGPLCGMGVCFECTLTIDGVQHQRSCQRVVADGMEIITHE